MKNVERFYWEDTAMNLRCLVSLPLLLALSFAHSAWAEGTPALPDSSLTRSFLATASMVLPLSPTASLRA